MDSVRLKKSGTSAQSFTITTTQRTPHYSEIWVRNRAKSDENDVFNEQSSLSLSLSVLLSFTSPSLFPLPSFRSLRRRRTTTSESPLPFSNWIPCLRRPQRRPRRRKFCRRRRRRRRLQGSPFALPQTFFRCRRVTAGAKQQQAGAPLVPKASTALLPSTCTFVARFSLLTTLKSLLLLQRCL